MGKGSHVRPHNRKKFGKEYDRIFGRKKLTVWQGAPPGGDSDGIQGDTGNGTRDSADSGRVAGVPQVPGGALDSQTAKPVEPPPSRDCPKELSKHPLDTAYWTYSGHRGEFNCPCGVGHGNHIHGCCEERCCQRDDFPLKKPLPCRNCGSTEYTPGGGYCDSCGGTF